MGRAGVGGEGRTPLSPTERRDAYGKDTASGPLAGFKGLRLTAGRRPTWVCVGLGRVHVKLSGAYWALGGAKVRNWSASEMGALY